jgi:hypothetical protein
MAYISRRLLIPVHIKFIMERCVYCCLVIRPRCHFVQLQQCVQVLGWCLDSNPEFILIFNDWKWLVHHRQTVLHFDCPYIF